MTRHELKRRGLIGWAIVNVERGSLLHTNWMLGNGTLAWPGQLPAALFRTRADARAALTRLKGKLPFQWYITPVRIEVGP